MKTPKDMLQGMSHETVPPSAARLLADAEQAADVRKKLDLLLRAWIQGEDATKKSAETQLAAFGATCPTPLVAQVVKRLFRHKSGEPLLVASESKNPVKQVNSAIKQRLWEISRLMLRGMEVHLVFKIFMVCLAIFSAKNDPEKTAEVIEAILSSWNEEPRHIKRCTLELLSNAAGRSRTTASESFEVVLRGCQDEDDTVRVRALQGIYVYASVCPHKANEVIDAAVIGCDDLRPTVSSEAIRQLGDLYGRCPERHREMASVMIDKFSEVEYTAQSSVVEHLADFAEACPERIEEIYAIAMSPFGDEPPSLQADVMGELVKLVKFCPDKETEIVSLVLSACDDEEDLDVIESAVNELANLVKACPGSAERIVEDMLRQSKNERCVKYGVLKRLGEVAALCPAKAEDIIKVFLCWCRFVCYEEEPIMTGDTSGADMEVVKVGRVLVDYSVDQLEIFRSAKEEVMSQLGRLAKLLPQKSDELFSAVVEGCDDECCHPKAAALDQMQTMIELWPERADQIVRAVVAACGDETHRVRSAGMKQLPWLATSCREQAEQFVELLCNGCHDFNWDAKIAALERSVEMMQTCPSKAKRLFSALLCGCGDERKCVSQAAKDQLEAALKLCPEFASDALLAMIQFSKSADSESKKRQMCSECPSVRAKVSRLS